MRKKRSIKMGKKDGNKNRKMEIKNSAVQKKEKKREKILNACYKIRITIPTKQLDDPDLVKRKSRQATQQDRKERKGRNEDTKGKEKN